MKVLAIDPGDTESGFCLMEGYKPVRFEKAKNEDMLDLIRLNGLQLDAVVIEMVASYGMAVGKNIFDTCVWIGRFWQEALHSACGRVEQIYRIEEKISLCHDSRAKDTNIRKALIDRFAEFDKENGKGSKSRKDWFYGFKKDVWMAYAVGVTFLDKECGKIINR